MADPKIMLAQHGLNPSKLTWPVAVYPKLDGVAADFYQAEGHVFPQALSRYHETLLSVDHIRTHLSSLLDDKDHILGELFIEGKDFKDISGLVRGHAPAPELKLHVYDFYTDGKEDKEYVERMSECVHKVLMNSDLDSPIRRIPALGRADNEKELSAIIDKFLQDNPKAEGVVIRPLYGAVSFYRAGKRSYGMQTVKRQDTVDVPVVSVEEALDTKTKQPKGMVGRLNVEFNGKIIGIGPGKLTHKERKELWEQWQHNQDWFPKTAEVSYKPDESYDALREARFERWRPDKDA